MVLAYSRYSMWPVSYRILLKFKKSIITTPALFRFLLLPDSAFFYLSSSSSLNSSSLPLLISILFSRLLQFSFPGFPANCLLIFDKECLSHCIYSEMFGAAADSNLMSPAMNTVVQASAKLSIAPRDALCT